MPLPSRAELLSTGGLYPIPIPFGWKLVGPDGQDEEIPVASGTTFHRLLAKGALLAREVDSLTGHPEVMMLRHFALQGCVTSAVLEDYAKRTTAALVGQHLESRIGASTLVASPLSAERCGKLVVHRMAPGDSRSEVHYLVTDVVGQGWQLVYLVRTADLERWTPLFAELEHD